MISILRLTGLALAASIAAGMAGTNPALAHPATPPEPAASSTPAVASPLPVPQPSPGGEPTPTPAPASQPSPTPTASPTTEPAPTTAPTRTPAPTPIPAVGPTPVGPTIVPVPRGTKKVTTTRTTVRIQLLAGAGSAHVVKTLAAGTAVVPSVTSGLWTRVTVGTTTGWVPARYLKTSTITVSVPNHRYLRTHTAAYASLGANGGTGVATSLDKRTKVELVATSGDWSQIKVGNAARWVKSLQIQATLPAATLRYLSTHTDTHVEANAKSRKVAVLDARTRVEVLNVHGSWSKARWGNATGWLATSRLRATLPAAVTAYTTTVLTATSGPGSGSATATLAQNTRVEKVNVNGAWTKVKYYSKSGWVRTVRLSASKTAVQHRWSTHAVNVRVGAGTGHRSLGVIGAWEQVAYHRSSGSWSFVSTSRGHGWIISSYLTRTGYYPVAAYGTLRKGQRAYDLLRGKTSTERNTRLVRHNLFLDPQFSWGWSYLVPSPSVKDTVAAEAMSIKKPIYTSTLSAVDRWERFDPAKPLATQNYNRKLVVDASGQQMYAYVASALKIAYMKSKGVAVPTGDYLTRPIQYRR
ncbi:gamma-glutamylcyclotransferase [Arthrobacter halodurans]|uniref:Gamma-glutamylcyclotransferase n=1 Tax=Arthrobacter halodurans TaxID=516699 RepID=A0ABV4UPB0_9MICC